MQKTPHQVIDIAQKLKDEHTGNLLKRAVFTRVGREFESEKQQFTFESLVTVDDPKIEPVASLATASGQ